MVVRNRVEWIESTPRIPRPSGVAPQDSDDKDDDNDEDEDNANIDDNADP